MRPRHDKGIPFGLTSIAGIGTIALGEHTVERPITHAELYEIKTALALYGRLAPPMQAGYDVIAGKDLEGTTVQVKYSEEGATVRPTARTGIWTFNHHDKGIDPDFMVLIGRTRQLAEHWFAMTYFNFVAMSTRTRTGRFLQLAVGPRSWRGSARKGYVNHNKGWDFLTSPANMYSRLVYLRSATQLTLPDPEGTA